MRVPSSARLSAEPVATLAVAVLSNPVVGQNVGVKVRGVEGQPLRLVLHDQTGRPLTERTVERAGLVERQTFSVGGRLAGVLLLRVSTPIQSVKALKTE